MFSLSNEAHIYKLNSEISIPNTNKKKEVTEFAIFTNYKKLLNSALGFGFRKDSVFLDLCKMIGPFPESMKDKVEAEQNFISCFQSRTVKTLASHGNQNYVLGMEFIWDQDGSLFAGAFAFALTEKILCNGSEPIEINYYESRFFPACEASVLVRMSDEIENIVHAHSDEDMKEYHSTSSDGFSSFFHTDDKCIRFKGSAIGQKIPICEPNRIEKERANLSETSMANSTSMQPNIEDEDTANSSTHEGLSVSNESNSITEIIQTCKPEDSSSSLDTYEVVIPYRCDVLNKRKDTLSIKVQIETDRRILLGLVQIKIDHPVHRNSFTLFTIEEEEDNDILFRSVNENNFPFPFPQAIEESDNISDSKVSTEISTVLQPKKPKGITKYDRKRSLNSKIYLTTNTKDSLKKFIGWKCKQCGTIIKGKKSNLNRHIEFVHNKKYDFECEYEDCKRKFQSVANLKRHILAVHKEKKLECTGCTRKFKSLSSLQEHIETVHAPDKENFQCSECGGCYSRKMVLDRHVKLLHR